MRHSLTIICGNAGTGKTTLGHELARQKAALLLDIDTVSERLVQAGLRCAGLDPNDRDSPQYKEAFRNAIHETLFAIAKENLAYSPCIIVAPFTQERRGAEFPKTIFAQVGVEARIIYLTCSDDVRRQRIAARNNPRDEGKLKDWESYSAQGRDESRPPFPHEFIDNSLS